MPTTEAAFERVQASRRTVRVAGLVTVAGIVPLFIPTGTVFAAWPALLILGGGAVATAAASIAADRAWVTGRLDGSRRWVTLNGVHPTFAAAVDVEQRRRRSGHPA